MIIILILLTLSIEWCPISAMIPIIWGSFSPLLRAVHMCIIIIIIIINLF